MDAYEKLKDKCPLDQNSFDRLIEEFQKDYLLAINYRERTGQHRNPIEVMRETLSNLNRYIIEIQQRKEMQDIDTINRSLNYVPTKINEIWKADKRIRTLYQAVIEYVSRQKKDVIVVGVHIAEYRAMNKLYMKINHAANRISITAQKKGMAGAIILKGKDDSAVSFSRKASELSVNNLDKVSKLTQNEKRVIFNSRPQSWQDLQNYVAQLFQEMGFEVEIGKVIEHVRGRKEVDVFAVDSNSEYPFRILVECKYWNQSVPQEIVHAFHDIMNNYGANVGFIVSKSGFQRGCYDAIKNSNINLVSLEELEEKYYCKWQAAMVSRNIPLSELLFPYWDPSGGKMPNDGQPISFDMQQLLDHAYLPLRQIDPRFFQLDGKSLYKYPFILPILNDQLEVVGEFQIRNDRDVFDFIEANKAKALRHYKLLYRET